MDEYMGIKFKTSEALPTGMVVLGFDRGGPGDFEARVVAEQLEDGSWRILKIETKPGKRKAPAHDS